MCKLTFSDGSQEGEKTSPSSSLLGSWHERIKLVGYGVDTLVLNVRYADKDFQPVQKELADDLVRELDNLASDARKAEIAVASSWAFKNILLFVEPHGAGRQWRWLLTSPYLTLVVSRGALSGLIAQVRFSSEYLWSEAWAGDALYHVHEFLMSIFGPYIHLQVSEIHLCADVVGYDFSLANYEQHFVTRVRKNDITYGADGVLLDCQRVSTLRFSSHASPLSCTIYNKTLEIKQKSAKFWFHDLWKKGVEGPAGGQWDGESDVWRIECRFKRAFLHNLKPPIEEAYDVLDHFQSLWAYAVGQGSGSDDGLPDGWLRYVVPSDDSNRSRWPVHPAWQVVQAAFALPGEHELGPVIRFRVRQKNIERGLAAVVGYSSTLAAWLGGQYATSDTDLSLFLHWLSEQGPEYLEEKQREFAKEVLKKQQRYGAW